MESTKGEPLTFLSYDEDQRPASLASAAAYLTGNLRILAHHGIDGSLLAISAQTASAARQVAQRSSGRSLDSVYFCHGIQGRAGSVCSFEIELDDGTCLRVADRCCEHETGYLENILPRTRFKAGSLEGIITTTAPVSRAEGRADRPVGILYSIELRNSQPRSISGQLKLRMTGQCFWVRGSASDWVASPDKIPTWDESAKAIVWSSSTPVALFVAADAQSEQDPDDPAVLVRDLGLDAGDSFRWDVFLTYEDTDASGRPANLSELRKRSGSEWTTATIRYWSAALGEFMASPDAHLSYFTPRAAQEALSCIRIDGNGNVVGVAPSPAPESEKPEYSDILYIAMPALYLAPSLYGRVIAWYASHLHPDDAEQPVDTQARVTPAIMAGLLHRFTGSLQFLDADSGTLSRIETLLHSVLDLLDQEKGLYATEVIRRHQPLMGHELGTNLRCWAAFTMWANVLKASGELQRAAQWQQRAQTAHLAIQEQFAARGPDRSGSLEGGWLWGGFKSVYETTLYALLLWEGDALDLAIAPLLGFCRESDEPWVNTMEYMFSPAYKLVRHRDNTLLWWAPWNRNGLARRDKWTDPSPLARLASVVGDKELDVAISDFRRQVDTNGTLWARDIRSGVRVERSGRELGGAYGIMLYRLLGIRLDCANKTIACLPRTNWRTTNWRGPDYGSVPVAVAYTVGERRAEYTVTNRTQETWTLRVGFRFFKEMEVRAVWVNGEACGDHLVIDEPEWHLVMVSLPLAPSTSVEVGVEMARSVAQYEPITPCTEIGAL